MSDDLADDVDFTDEEMRGSQPEPGFSGVRLFTGTDGNMAMTLFQDGRMIDLEPHEDFRSLPLGFYDYDMKPVPDPADPAG